MARFRARGKPGRFEPHNAHVQYSPCAVTMHPLTGTTGANRRMLRQIAAVAAAAPLLALRFPVAAAPALRSLPSLVGGSPLLLSSSSSSFLWWTIVPLLRGGVSAFATRNTGMAPSAKRSDRTGMVRSNNNNNNPPRSSSRKAAAPLQLLCSRDSSGTRRSSSSSTETFPQLQPQAPNHPQHKNARPVRVVVIGGGWAGFSAADSLSGSAHPSGAAAARASTQQPHPEAAHPEVILLDASPRGPGGLAAGWTKHSNSNSSRHGTARTVEAGLHGFWREYRNTIAAVERIVANQPAGDTENADGRRRLDATPTTARTISDVLTPFTPSVLYSSAGRVALAPVMGAPDGGSNNATASFAPSRAFELAKALFAGVSPTGLAPQRQQQEHRQRALLQSLAALLPPPLDVAILAEFAPQTKLTLADRASAVSLLPAWADFDPADAASWLRYDSLSAESLFRAVAGVSEPLYTELVSPLLHVLPMCPGYDCSAAAALSCLHAFALQSRGAFDVRWCRGSLSTYIFDPWVRQLHARRHVRVRGNAVVTALAESADDDGGGTYAVTVNGNETIMCDAVVFAVGIAAAQRLLGTCPPLAAVKETAKWHQLRGVTCVCVRLFFHALLPPAQLSKAMVDSPVAVCGAGILPELAETGFCIYDLSRLQDEFRDGTAALEVDFFRANRLLQTCPTDEAVAQLTLRAVSKALGIAPIDPALLADVSVVRARNAVSHFAVGSASCTPSSVRLRRGLYICGDWVDRTGHASWSTEKSVVTGRQAAAAVAADFRLRLPLAATSIIPAAPDTPQLAAARSIAKLLRSTPGQRKGLPKFP